MMVSMNRTIGDQLHSKSETGYRQIYIIKRHDDGGISKNNIRNVFFQCGRFCYEGSIKLDFLDKGLISIANIPKVAPSLYKSQKDLSFVSESPSETYSKAIQSINEAQSFLERELTSSRVLRRLDDHENELDLFDEGHYFELVGDIDGELEDVECICAKSYTDGGLCLVVMYFEGIFYSILSETCDDEPLLNIHFPDVSQEGDGITLATYDEEANRKSYLRWRKLSLWQTRCEMERYTYDNLSSCSSLPSWNYEQTYCILKPNKPEKCRRDVLFRFGNWCYTGDIELIDSLSLEDIPHVIPALRIQQHNLNFLCNASDLPDENKFTETLLHNSRVMNILESEILSLDRQIEDIEKKLCLNKESTDNEAKIFFEFDTMNQKLPSNYCEVDLIATKTYRPNGLIIVTIYFSGTYYVCISDGDGSDQPLLDCEFPPIIQANGYQVKTYPSGLASFPELRKLKVWQSSNGKNQSPLDICISSNKDEVVENVEDTMGKDISINSLNSFCDNAIVEKENESSDFEEKENENSDFKEVVKGSFNVVAESLSQRQDDETNIYENLKKVTNFNIIKSSNHRKKQNLGAFHHLAPLKKTPRLSHRVGSMKLDLRKEKVPYNGEGKPLHV